jgi:hypothetical protein
MSPYPLRAAWSTRWRALPALMAITLLGAPAAAQAYGVEILGPPGIPG